MPVSFTVREVSAEALVVDYGDGSWASIPLRNMETKTDILKLIAAFNHGVSKFESAADVPFSVGESGNVQTIQEEAEAAKELAEQRLLTYKELRAPNYPPISDQLDAMYWSRQGDDTAQQDIDALIAGVKESFPKDMEPITQAEFNALLNEAAE